MNLPIVLNSYSLFQNLNGLTIPENYKLDKILQEIFSRGTSAVLNIQRIQELNQLCVSEFEIFEKQLNLKDNRIVFGSTSLGFLLNEISPLMTTLRLLQNLMMKLIKELDNNNNLPNSINDYFKKPENYKIKETIKAELVKHWNSTGKQLKSYRDTDQHYDWLLNRYFIELSPQKKIVLELPDNPETKSIKKYTFERKINALEFLIETFNEIHITFENIAIIFGAQKTPHQLKMTFSQLGDLVPVTDRTIGLFYNHSVSPISQTELKHHIEGQAIHQTTDMGVAVSFHKLSDEELQQLRTIPKAK